MTYEKIQVYKLLGIEIVEDFIEYSLLIIE